MEIALRAVAATPADQEFLYRVFTSTRAAAPVPPGWQEAEVDALRRRQFLGQGAQLLGRYPDAVREIILVDGCPAGRIYLDRPPGSLHLIELSLLPEFRFRGIGGRLLAELFQESEQLGIPLTLQVDMENPIGEYYRRLGFVEQAVSGFYRHLERWPGKGHVA